MSATELNVDVSAAKEDSETVTRGNTLKRVPLGKTGLMVTEVCAGTMCWGSLTEAEEDAHSQLDALHEHGVNYIDTAELYPVGFNYGRTTEKWIGNWLQKRSAAGTLDRGQLVIQTKCNMAGVGGDGGGGPHGYDEGTLMASCRASIERLRCGHIDVYLLHWPSRDTPIFGCSSFYPDGEHRACPFVDQGDAVAFEQQVLAIKALLDAGLIKHWGLSNETSFGLTMFCATCDRLGVPRPAVCENEYSLVNRTYEVNGWEAAYRFGIAGVQYGALSGGSLTGKYLPGSKYADRPLEDCRHCKARPRPHLTRT